MVFLLQSDSSSLELENRFLKETLCRSGHSVQYATIKTIKKGNFDTIPKDSIVPVGDIAFVEQALTRFFDIRHINPMEIPVCLRREKFLKRKYDIVRYKNLPESGTYFIKDVSKLKSLIAIGNRTNLDEDNVVKSHFFQCSEFIQDILSEYRIYFIDGKIENICNYNGDPTVFPNVPLINEANGIFMNTPSYPQSYTMDVMVTRKGTSIIELHPFVSVGLYSTLWGKNLANAYIDGINYLRHFNVSCY